MIIQGHTAGYLTTILNAFKDLVFLFDDEEIIVDYLPNQSSEWYLPKQQFIGKHHTEVLPPHVSEKIQGAIHEIRRGKNTSTFDYHLAINGKTAWFTAVISPILKPDGLVPNYLCVIREITDSKEKELLLQGVLEDAFNAFIVFRSIRNSEGRVIDFEWVMFNRQAEKMIGKTPMELKEKRIKGIFDQGWILFQEYVAVAESGKPLDLEYSYSRGGSTVWLHTHALKLADNVVVAIKNISEQKRADENLKEVVDQLRANRLGMEMFFTQALSGFFFMKLDKPVQWNETTDKPAAVEYTLDHLRITRVNNAFLQQYGATEDEFLNIPLKDVFRGDLENARKLVYAVYDKGRVHTNRPTRKMDGGDLWVEGNYILFTDQNNNILGVFGIQNDVTERKRAEEALRASEERYRLLANNMLDLLTLHDPDGTYKYLSPSVSKILGYSPEELIGTSPYAIFHPDDIMVIREESHKKAVEGEIIPDIEYRIRKKDGEYIWFSTNTKPIKNAEGKVVMLQAVSRDITDKIETLNALRELNHQKSKLFSIIAHDLRGPLASCMGLLNMTKRELPPEDLQKYLLLARKSAYNLHELMEDLLLWAGSQLDKISYDPVILSLTEELEELSRRFVETAQSKNIAIGVDVEEDLPSVYADRDMIRTIVRNLLSNAIKFTSPGGRVQVQAKARDGIVEVSVEDNGIGIKKEDIDKLFGKGANYTTYGTGGEKGTGLGLDICKDFVEKHGGKIWAESEFGKGSRFIFTLKEF